MNRKLTARALAIMLALMMIAPAFVNGVDAWIELNHMYDIVFPKLLRIIRGTMPNNDQNEESVYREVELIGGKNMRWNVNDENRGGEKNQRATRI